MPLASRFGSYEGSLPLLPLQKGTKELKDQVMTVKIAVGAEHCLDMMLVSGAELGIWIPILLRTNLLIIRSASSQPEKARSNPS